MLTDPCGAKVLRVMAECSLQLIPVFGGTGQK